MKLLIADDEALTREGLISSIDWNALGIREIFQADDGINALHIAKIQMPDIILCDIRMPRMTGIEMAEKLKAFLPDSSIIFMSGYSDKEYLKAAIKLNAINYVEKPLNPEEVKDAILEARKRRLEIFKTRRNENLYSLESSFRLGSLLTRPYSENKEDIQKLCTELSLTSNNRTSYTTFIVKLKDVSPDPVQLQTMRTQAKTFLFRYHLNFFYTQLHAVYHVFFVTSDTLPTSTVLSLVSDKLKDVFSLFGDFYISQGETVFGIANAYHSYTDAAIALQHSFFFQPGTILLSKEITSFPHKDNLFDEPSRLVSVFSDALLSKEQDGCNKILSGLYNSYYQNLSLLPVYTKDLYYKLFMSLEDCAKKLKLSPDTFTEFSTPSILDFLENCFSFLELHQMLETRTESFFDSLNVYLPEDSTIFLIKDYISKHYSNDALSIREISDHVHLSASYICTYFKNQTGQTLNQYLTEYRMEKAIRLLEDVRYQITDISSKVGYSNGNYFSKSFKKYTGVTPSKYRENILK